MTTVASQPGLFNDLPPRQRSPLALRWVLLALAVHLALLTVPDSGMREVPPQASDRSIDVRLVAPETPQRPEPAPVMAPPLETPAPEPLPAEDIAEVATPLPLPAAPTQTTDRQPQPLEALPEPPPASFEVERLLEAVSAMDWSTPEAVREVSRDTSSAVLDRLRTPVLPAWTNQFDGMHAPSEVEIMDRWVDPNGTQQVVVRSPDGETYCGRQGPVDDLRPWLQMPMLFHKCAGGGKRDQGSSWRNN